jgi:hypothetical protein
MHQPRFLIPLVAFLASNVLVVSAAGQIPLNELHHTFHIALPTLAFAIFSGYVALDARKHGWPRFSWSLQPPVD